MLADASATSSNLPMLEPARFSESGHGAQSQRAMIIRRISSQSDQTGKSFLLMRLFTPIRLRSKHRRRWSGAVKCAGNATLAMLLFMFEKKRKF